jgi:hypothetical protein
MEKKTALRLVYWLVELLEFDWDMWMVVWKEDQSVVTMVAYWVVLMV